jgi:hypothetical protein
MSLELAETFTGRDYSYIQGSARLFGRVYCLKRPSMGPFQDLRDAPGSLKLDEETPSSGHAFANLRSNNEHYER